MCATTQPAAPFQTCPACGSSCCRDFACSLAEQLAGLVPDDGWEAFRVGTHDTCPHDWRPDVQWTEAGEPVLTRCCSECKAEECPGAAHQAAVANAINGAAMVAVA